jgi:hypothetical protein
MQADLQHVQIKQSQATAAGVTGGPPPSDADLDAALSRLENNLHQIKTHKAKVAPVPPSHAVPPSHLAAPPHAVQPSHEDMKIHAALGQMQTELHHLKTKQSQATTAGETGGPPPSDGDLDAALSRMEHNLHEIKTHKAKVDAEASKPPPDPPPVDMPHWEHHKYKHHEITDPAWKPDKNITDMYGHKHAASEYHYTNYGAGSHGHHLAHFHLNDYHGLAHHSFKTEEYHKQQYGDAAHHGHWVPHLHGIGTSSHHGEHAYGKEEYHNDMHGAPGHHAHWVPHLHGIGGSS